MNTKLKIVMVAVLIIAGIGGVAALVAACGDSQNTKQGSVATTDTPVEAAGEVSTQIEPVDSAEAAKTDNSGNYLPQVTVEDTAGLPDPPTDNPPLKELGAFVTAQKEYGGDKIAILFYLESPGSYTIQEFKSGQWQTSYENVVYPGSGSLPAGEIPAGEETRTVRALKIESGSYVAISKEFTISRSEVISAGGIKTYTG